MLFCKPLRNISKHNLTSLHTNKLLVQHQILKSKSLTEIVDPYVNNSYAQVSRENTHSIYSIQHLIFPYSA